VLVADLQHYGVEVVGVVDVEILLNARDHATDLIAAILDVERPVLKRLDEFALDASCAVGEITLDRLWECVVSDGISE